MRSDGGNQLCVAIKLSFLSPSNGLPFPWFWVAWSSWSVCKAPSLTLSLCPIYGNEPSALSVTAAQIEERLVEGGVSLTDRSLRQRRLSCCVCLCTSGCLQMWIRLSDGGERRQIWNRSNVFKGRCNGGRYFEHRLCVCACRDRESDRDRECYHLQVSTLSCFTQRALVISVLGWPTPQSHSRTILARYYTTLPLCRAAIWMCLSDSVTQESGGHTSQYRATQHSIDLCCHWILDWLPSQHMCLTVISPTD